MNEIGATRRFRMVDLLVVAVIVVVLLAILVLFVNSARRRAERPAVCSE